MSKRAIAIVIGGLMLAGATVSAEEAAQGTAPHVVSDYKRVPKFEDEKVVCKRVTQTGTRVEKKICTTQKERDADRKIAKGMLDDIGRKAALQKHGSQ